MDRKIELDKLTEDDFQSVMDAANKEVLNLAKSAQDKINEILIRFGVQCEISLAYKVAGAQKEEVKENKEYEDDVVAEIPAVPVKKKRKPRKKVNKE
jgi:hypothetical protein